MSATKGRGSFSADALTHQKAKGASQRRFSTTKDPSDSGMFAWRLLAWLACLTQHYN